MSKIAFAEDAWEEYLWWQTQDKKTLKRINGLLRSIQREPYAGMGKPEPLRGSKMWSRRINEKDRLVYEIRDDLIVIEQCRGHYEDK